MKMMTSLDNYKLDRFVEKFMPLDLHDKHERDQTLSYYENKRILAEKYGLLLSPAEQIELGLYEPESDSVCSIDGTHFRSPPKCLTALQKEVLDLLLQGYSQRDIARMIRKARETVKKHFQAIKKKGYAVFVSYNKYRYLKPDEVSG